MMRVLVCGGRAYNNAAAVTKELDAVLQNIGIDVLVEGGASGADRLAMRWAIDNNVLVETVMANWQQHGRKAGPMRNSEMLESGVDLVVAFPGGRGTANMVRQARAMGVKVREVVT